MLGFFFKPWEQMLFDPDNFNEGKNPLLTSKLHVWNLVWIKSGISHLLFWVNIGMWPIISVQLAMPDTTMMSEYMIYMVWKLIAIFCLITCVTSMWQFQKLVVTGYLNNTDMHVQMKFRKFENCTFCDITSSNVHRFSSNLQNRRSLSRWFSWGVETLCSHQNYTCEIWSKLKKQNISLNFWVNIGVWPIVSMRLAMPNVTVMSEYTWFIWFEKLIAMFCPITCVMFIWQFQKLVVTG